jgi:hypothetical protein
MVDFPSLEFLQCNSCPCQSTPYPRLCPHHPRPLPPPLPPRPTQRGSDGKTRSQTQNPCCIYESSASESLEPTKSSPVLSSQLIILNHTIGLYSHRDSQSVQDFVATFPRYDVQM